MRIHLATAAQLESRKVEIQMQVVWSQAALKTQCSASSRRSSRKNTLGGAAEVVLGVGGVLPSGAYTEKRGRSIKP